MTKQNNADGKKAPLFPATVLYFLEDGRVTASPWDPEPPTQANDDASLADKRDQTVAFDESELPWMNSEEDVKTSGAMHEVSVFQLDQLSLPEEVDAEVDADEFEEVSDETEEVEQAFQAQNFSETTQIEEIPSDAHEERDDLLDAIGAACSDEEVAHAFSSMPTLRPTPVRSDSKSPAANVWGDKAPMTKSKSFPSAFDAPSRTPSGRPMGKVVHASSAPTKARIGEPTLDWNPFPESDEKPKHTAQRSRNAALQRETSDHDTLEMDPPAPQPSSVQSSHQFNDVDEASICLLASPQAVAHYQAHLEPMIQTGKNASEGSSSAKRAQWATAALFGQKLFTSGRPVPAQKVLEKLIAEKVTESFPYAMLGALYLAQGNETEAQQLFEQALDMDSTDVGALLGRSEICLRNACPVEALVDVKLAINQAKLDDSPLLGRAEAMLGVAQALMHFMK